MLAIVSLLHKLRSIAEENAIAGYGDLKNKQLKLCLGIEP